MDQEYAQPFHQVADGIVCDTEGRGYATPGNRSIAEIVVDASEGFIPLWVTGSTLRWRFQERSLVEVPDSDSRCKRVVELMSEALLQWGAAAPVKFTRDNDLWDFEFVLRDDPRCNPQGCVLASAFFPDSGRHSLTIYPTMFDQSEQEQVETLIHEFGHVFGLRHFFAAISETAWPSETFGVHSPFSIMNYGSQSQLTEADLQDLTELYRLAWSGELPHINGTPIRFVKPYSALAGPGVPLVTNQMAAAARTVYV